MVETIGRPKSNLDKYLDECAKRETEKIKIDDAGPLVAAVCGGIALVCNRQNIDIKETMMSMLNKFKSATTRSERIIMINNAQTCARSLAPFETYGKPYHFATETMRLALIRSIIKENIAFGQDAVLVADIIFGRGNFRLEDNILVKEWRVKQARRRRLAQKAASTIDIFLDDNRFERYQKRLQEKGGDLSDILCSSE